MAIRGLNTKNINRALIYSHYPQCPHKDSITEVELINDMYETEVHGINGFSECAFSFAILYGDFINEVVVSEEKKKRSEKLTKAEFENLRKRLVHNCPKKEICHRCSIENGDCRLLHGWKKEEGSDNYTYSYPILGEYLPDLKKVVLYWNNIDNACGKPTYNGVLSTYIHELFHAYFHYVTEQKQAEYNYIKEIEEAMTEFCTLVFIRFMKNECSVEWYDIFDWASERIGKKQNIAGGLPAYGFGRYLFDNIPEDEAFDWINKYAERLGNIDEEDELVKQYKQMIYPCYPSDPDKCLELLRKILFETNNKPIKPRDVKGNRPCTMKDKTEQIKEYSPIICRGFDENTQKSLGYYVYLLVDPRDGKPFYVGKGQNNRVFDHVQDAIDNPEDNRDKYDRIRSIGPENVLHFIVSHGLSQDEAFLVESALIDVLKHFNIALTNSKEGNQASVRGIMTTDEIKRLYSAGNLDYIESNCMIININARYTRAMGYDGIFEATHETWRINKNKVKQIQYVLSEYRGLIIEVFEVEEWYQKERPTNKHDSLYLGWGFKGHRAPDEIRNKYINKSIAHKKRKGMSYPIRYSL